MELVLHCALGHETQRPHGAALPQAVQAIDGLVLSWKTGDSSVENQGVMVMVDPNWGHFIDVHGVCHGRSWPYAHTHVYIYIYI